MAICGIGVQTKEAIDDACPEEGFRILKEAGFSHVDFSLNKYMINKDIYQMKNSHFFDRSIDELKESMPVEITSKIEWRELMKEVDKDNDNQMSFEEFKEMMQKLLVN